MSITFVDNSAEVLQALAAAEQKALESCGIVGEGYAKALAAVDTGNLRNSITHEVHEKSVDIGTPTEYAPYVEFGTGVYAPGGRPTPWFYVDGNGVGHYTHGQRPQPYIKPAVAEHKDDYKKIIENTLKG